MGLVAMSVSGCGDYRLGVGTVYNALANEFEPAMPLHVGHTVAFCMLNTV